MLDVLHCLIHVVDTKRMLELIRLQVAYEGEALPAERPVLIVLVNAVPHPIPTAQVSYFVTYWAISYFVDLAPSPEVADV
jgi:hypothetical protein